ncbi:MAG: hypothetical protein ABH873_09250 [Candidatus Firestonebacteria bacterium]
MRKFFVCVVILGFVFSFNFTSKVYGEKEVLWGENYDKFEEGEDTGLIQMSGGANVEIQGKIANGGKGKALKLSPIEDVDYSAKYDIFGVTKDMTFLNESATLSFYYYAKGASGLGVMCLNRTVKENCELWLSKLVQEKWTKAVIRISNLKVKGGAGKIKEGDEFRYLHLMPTVGSGPLKDQFIVLDDISFTIGSGDSDEKKEEKKK